MFMRFVRITLWALVAIASLVYLGYRFLYPLLGSQNEDMALVSESVQVGGPYHMTTHLGESVTQDDFKGRYSLMFFGYTFCPDICPFELATMSAALDQLAAQGVGIEQIQPLFITIDPERDTVDALNDYVAAFHPKLIGLTGSVEEVRAMTDVFAIYAQKAETEEQSDYLMNHSSLIYLMGKEGEFIRYFAPGRSAEEMAQGLEDVLTGASNG